MKITVLAENTALSEEYLSEHGLSLYIETEKHKILFDMGQTDIFLENAKKLGVDISAVDIAILSHGHYDHGGGLSAFLSVNSKARVYINENAFGDYYSGTEKYIGLDKTLRHSERLLFLNAPVDIDEELSIYPFDKSFEKKKLGSFGLYKKENGNFVPDDFLHEHYLLIKENGKRVVISGCSHNGIMNIVDFLRPDVLIGGFHFSKISTDSEGRGTLSSYADHLLSFDTVYYTCHCTGESQYLHMKEVMKEKLSYIRTGSRIIV